ncbi:MAG: 4-(cytidine 5'-diphospho)-2-C-methyl-D-erythritol kinase [Bacteroidota bacterium]|jgi:4-diphosphocytidyl-2-C-methyl-D-erythritol kinase
MISFPNAKINLGLKVVNKRLDGYHDIETIFLPLSWRDALEIIEDTESKGKNKVNFSSSGLVINGHSNNNLVIKAYSLIDSDFDLPPVKIHLHKCIPMGAGLGGGSSNAAFTIKLLNDLFTINLDVERMKNYASKLGSDCAFFIEGKPVFASGKGDIFENITINENEKHILTIWPGIHSNTADAYSGINPSKPKYHLKDVISSGIINWQNHLENDFEKTIFNKYPLLSEIKNSLYEKGAIYSSMSGSGSAVFGIFDEEPKELKWPSNYLVNLSKLSFH